MVMRRPGENQRPAGGRAGVVVAIVAVRSDAAVTRVA